MLVISALFNFCAQMFCYILFCWLLFLFSPKILADYVSSADSNAKKHLKGELGALRINLT